MQAHLTCVHDSVVVCYLHKVNHFFFFHDIFSKVSRVSKWLLSVTALWSPSSLMETSIRYATAQWSSLPSPAVPTPATHLLCLEQVSASLNGISGLSLDLRGEYLSGWRLTGLSIGHTY